MNITKDTVATLSYTVTETNGQVVGRTQVNSSQIIVCDIDCFKGCTAFHIKLLQVALLQIKVCKLLAVTEV